MKRTLMLATILCISFFAANAQSDTTTVTMAAGKQYAASAWKKIWWGKHYRKEWTTPVPFPVFHMSQYHGGLTPLKLGGGHQSKSLRLESGEGKEYVLRTIDKDLDVLIPEEFKNTFINDLVNDQISTAHPYGPIAIAEMADQLSFYHTNPVIVYIPDDPALGEFRMTFANKLCLLEERPSGKGWEHTPLTGDADNVLNSEDLIEKVESNTKNRVDQKELLKVRLFDMVVNDWDRHEDQWVWLEHKRDEDNIYLPLGRDRDQAFSKTDGIALWLLSRPWALRPLQNMQSKVHDLLGENFSARNLDREFLNELKRKDWQDAISYFQTHLTDSGIHKAVYKMPAAVNKISGDFVETKLKERRDNLGGYGMKYYDILAKTVVVAGSEKKEQFIFDNISADEVSLTGLRKNADTFYHRIFYRNETKEINVYGLDGDDEFVFTGTGPNKFTIRTIGGPGNNVYTNSKSSSGGKKIRIYDSLFNQDLSHRTFKIKTRSDTLYNYNRKWVKYDYYIPVIIPGYNPDDGFTIGLGFLYRKQKWGKAPYGWQQLWAVNYATGTSALGFLYKGTFKRAVGSWDFDLEAKYRGPLYVLNYYGLGNETVLDSNDKKFYRVKSRLLDVSPGLSKEWRHSFLRFGLQYQSVNILENQDKFITTIGSGVDPDIFEKRYYGGVSGEWDIYSNPSRRNPKNGVRFESGFNYLHGFNGPQNDLLKLHASFAFYLTAGNAITLAHRTGAETVFGDYEFYHAAAIGGNTNLRGYWRDRFQGTSSFYQNTELRLKLGHLRGYVLRGDIGLLGFFDDGRVWLEGENSSTLHTGYGGGIYFLPYSALALNLYYAKSKEVNMVVLRAGFFF